RRTAARDFERSMPPPPTKPRTTAVEDFAAAKPITFGPTSNTGGIRGGIRGGNRGATSASNQGSRSAPMAAEHTFFDVPGGGGKGGTRGGRRGG
ncbi:hypothetical protein MKX01_029501, partial [Papaver californicum]